MTYPVGLVSDQSFARAASITVSLSALTYAANDLILHKLTNDEAGAGSPISLGFSAVTRSGDTLTYAGSNIWADGDEVVLTGTPPTGLSQMIRYFVRDIATGPKTFKLALTPGGTAITLSSAGTSPVVHQMKSVTTGWEMIGIQQTSTLADAHRSAYAFKVAGASEADPVFYASLGVWISGSQVWGDIDTTTPIGNWQRNDVTMSLAEHPSSTVAKSSNGTSQFTASQDDSVLIYGWCIDGGDVVRVQDGAMTLLSKTQYTNTTTTCHVWGYIQQGAAAVPPTITAFATGANGVNSWVIELRNKTAGGAGGLAPDCRHNMVAIDFGGSIGAYIPAQKWGAPNSTLAPSAITGAGATIAGIAVSAVVGAISTATGFANAPWGSLTTITSNDDCSVTAKWCGAVKQLPAGAELDLTDSLLSIHWAGSTSGTGIGVQGFILLLGDGDGTTPGNWAAYQLATEASNGLSSEHVSFIALGNATLLDSSGTLDLANVSQLCLAAHKTGATSLLVIYYKNIHKHSGYATMFGGCANAPVSGVFLQKVMSQWSYRLADLNGTRQVIAKTKFQVANGGIKTYSDFSGSSVEFPLAFSMAPGLQDWNCGALAAGVNVKASSGDIINIAAGVMASATVQPFSIDPASSTSAAYSFLGESFLGLPISLQPGISYTGATFKSGSITLGAAGTYTFNAGNSQAITLTPTANDQAYDLSGCSFVAAMTVVNSTSFTGITFAKPTGSTVTDDSGANPAVTITSAVNTLTIAASVTLVGAEVRVYDLDNTPAGSYGTELGGIESCIGATFSLPLSSGNTVQIQIMKGGYVEFVQEYTMGGTATFTAVLEVDTYS